MTSAARSASGGWPRPPTTPGWGSSSTSSRTTWRPTTPTPGGPTRRTRAEVFDYDPETGWYRRFFDVDGLAGVRQEDPAVFERTHAKVFELLDAGLVDGLRIDHPDGLADPAGYLERLRGRGARHVWIEKILHHGEAAPAVAGRGDDRLRVPRRRHHRLRRPCGRGTDHAGVPGADRRRPSVRRGGPRGPPRAGDHDLRPGGRAAARAGAGGRHPRGAGRPARVPHLHRRGRAPHRRRRPGRARTGEPAPRPLRPADEPATAAPLEFVTRFQQTRPPVVAKGVEDTALYRSTRLLALNDVGGDPGRFSMSVDELHRTNLERQERFPAPCWRPPPTTRSAAPTPAPG